MSASTRYIHGRRGDFTNLEQQGLATDSSHSEFSPPPSHRHRVRAEKSSGSEDSEIEVETRVSRPVTYDGGHSINVYSSYLTEAIARVNKHTLRKPTGGRFTDTRPFPVFFYHIEDVRKEIAQLDDEDANNDLKELNDIVAKIEPAWEEACEIDFDSGFVSFNALWRLFYPGDVVVHYDILGSMWKLCFVSLEYRNQILETERGRRLGGKSSEKIARVIVWGLKWDIVEERLTRENFEFDISEFSDQIPITSLLIFPFKYLSEESVEKFDEYLIERGKVWWNFVRSRTSYLQCNGIALHHKGKTARHEDDEDYEEKVGARSKSQRYALAKRIKIGERVIIDDESKAFWRLEIDQLYRSPPNRVEGLDQREYYQWDKLEVTTQLTNEQAAFCPPNIGCHALSDFVQYIVKVDDLEYVVPDTTSLDRLVMDDKKKDILKGLVGQHYNKQGIDIEGDLIEGKGNGLVILMHGPPGVGKTLTAECVSRAIGKPLIALSIGDMVWDERNLQRRLQDEFARATEWGAILLLDEADVVLEARSFEDVRRNGMVSVFLRQLEYYQGVLFLTSNRVSTMDVAFQSRIQIGISFKKMTPPIRSKIWGQLLKLNGRDKMIGESAVEEVKQRLGKFDLNGRQIRNVLNVADGLAFNEYGESGKLKYSHIQQAVESAVEFQNMLEEAKSSMKNEQTVWSMYRGGDDEF